MLTGCICCYTEVNGSFLLSKSFSCFVLCIYIVVLVNGKVGFGVAEKRKLVERCLLLPPIYRERVNGSLYTSSLYNELRRKKNGRSDGNL
jgi:hypothetical protein